MPEIISYFVYGYIYLTAYYWVSFKSSQNFKYILFKSVAVNYILTVIYQIICGKLGIVLVYTNLQTVILVVVSMVLGLCVGRFIVSHWFNGFLHLLHIGRTTNDNIWDDIIKPCTWVCVYMKDGTSYMGQYRYGEPFQREPIVALATYLKYDKYDNIVSDKSQDKNRMILLNTKDFEKIEIIYDEKQESQDNQSEKK